MTGLELLLCGASLLLLLAGGWAFLNYSLYRDFENKNHVVQVLFSAVFALSSNLLLMLLFEILGVMTQRCGGRAGGAGRVSWRLCAADVSTALTFVQNICISFSTP